jgi:hypothetical protein
MAKKRQPQNNNFVSPIAEVATPRIAADRISMLANQHPTTPLAV